MAFGFDILIENLSNIGFYNFFLPFLLILALTYGILKTINFSGGDTGVIAVISIAVAFLTLGGLYFFVRPDFFPLLFSSLSIYLIAIFGIILILGLLGVKIENLSEQNWFKALALIVAIMLVLATLFSITGFWDVILNLRFTEDALQVFLTVLLIIALVLIIWFIMREKK